MLNIHNLSVSFGGTYLFEEVTFRLGAGDRVGLVGKNGAGKSTMADLLPRFYDVTEGGIYVDGQDIRTLTTHSLRDLIGIVSQEPILFNDTVFNNIAFGIPDAKLEDVINAAKIANAHEFIASFPEGYETVVGERGMKLSGGQRQRIAIARAILKDPVILILDEATSSLDSESEALVQQALHNLMQNRTSFVIAHRLSTIRNADLIVVLEHGQVIEAGTHQQLMQLTDGLYRNMTRLQVEFE